MFKIQKLSNLAVMESGNRRRRGAEEGSGGDTEESYGGGAEERLAEAVARRRDWLRRWRGGEIGGAVTLWRDGEEMENLWRRWRDRRRWWTVA